MANEIFAIPCFATSANLAGMNKVLERAIAEAAKLPEDQQEAIAARILEEIEIGRGWDERFANSPGVLDELSRKAEEHIRRGTTLPRDPADLPQK